MISFRIFVLSALTLLIMSSCSKKLTPFTTNLYAQNQWSEEELKSIQFYLSDDIVIRRQLKDASSEIVEGEIKMIDGRQVEEIIIPKGTPGILEFVRDEKYHFGISFEEGKYLMFGPNPKRGGEYVLLASGWKNRVGKIRYDDKNYYTGSGDGYAKLMVNLKKINQRDYDSRKVKGRTID